MYTYTLFVVDTRPLSEPSGVALPPSKPAVIGLARALVPREIDVRFVVLLRLLPGCVPGLATLYEAVKADDPNGEDDDAERENENERDVEARMASMDLRTPEGNAAGVRHLRKIEQKVRRTRGAGRRVAKEDEKVSSPFPFLDLASKLIVALAEGE